MPVIAKRGTRRVGRPPNPPDAAIAARIRALRSAAGLTQAELAGKDFSKGFISLLETARVGLSPRAAQVLAPRLRVPVDELARRGRPADKKLELALARAEADLAAGRYAEALHAASALHKAPPDLRGRALRVSGRALLESDRAGEAITTLDEALRLFRQHRDRELAARTLFDLARAHARVEAHGEAARYALECENALVAGDVVDASLEMRLLAFLAGVFVTLGDLTSADLRMERARRSAEDVAEPHGVGNLYYHLAVLRQRENDPEAALRYAIKAIEAYEQLGVRAYLGSVWNMIGWIHIKRGQFDRAKEALATAEHIAEEVHDDRLAAYVLQNQAQLELARGRASDAVRLADESISHPNASQRARALSLLVKAEALAKADADIADVNAAYQLAVQALEPFGANLSARAHRSHFAALVARGLVREATDAAEAAFTVLKPILA